LNSKPNPAALLRRLCAGHGLYFLGAGASTGEAPFGAGFLRDPLIDFLRHAGSFSTNQPEHPPLSRLLLDADRYRRWRCAGVMALRPIGGRAILRPSIFVTGKRYEIAS
jgi:hypothetical protein